MKRYRYNARSSGPMSPFQRYRPVLYAFVAWNMLGFFGWRYLTSNAQDKDPSWDDRSEAERILAVYGTDTSQATTRKISLFGKPATGTDGQDSRSS